MTFNMDWSRLVTSSMLVNIEDVVSDPTPPPLPPPRSIDSVDLDPLTFVQPDPLYNQAVSSQLSSQGQSLPQTLSQDQSDDLDDLLEILHDMVGDPTSPPSSPPLHPGSIQPVYLDPLTLLQPGPLCNQAALYSQRPPIVNHTTTGYSAAPPQPDNTCTAQQIQSLPLFGYLPDGQAVHLLPAPTTVTNAPTTAATTPTTVTTKKRKRVEQHHDGPYVKKPPNAFMLFMKEQRPNYAADMKSSGCAVVNTFLGQKWKSLSYIEQAKYYQQADGEKSLHAQRHPDWAPGNNYGVKRKRDRSRAAKLEAKLAKASTSGEVTQLAKKLCVAENV